MNEDFHYYATYCAAYLAGYSHEESLTVAYSAAFVDFCSRTLLEKIKAPRAAATTQLQMELMDAATDITGLQDITRIWASFHFLPRDLHADPGCGSRNYRDKYRLICGPNGDLAVGMVKRAKEGSLEKVGLSMHVLADTWAHMNFAGTPSLVINNTNPYFTEILPEGERPIRFRHRVTEPDDPDKGKYTGSLYQANERSVMNLGHGRAGHLPDYSYICYRYLPAWDHYREHIKDNPSDFMLAFRQMTEAMKYIRGDVADFTAGQYDTERVAPYEAEIREILVKRQISAAAEWKALGEKLSGREIESFDVKKYQKEYMEAAADSKDDTVLGRFILSALDHKSYVTNQIFRSGNWLAGRSIEYNGFGFKGIKDYAALLGLRKDRLKWGK